MITSNGWIDQLNRRCARLGITKMAVAKRARVSPSTVRRILSGREDNPSVPIVQAIAKSLGVEIRLGESITVDESQDAEEYKRTQALAKAKRIVRMVQATMALEAQGVDSKVVDRLIEKAVYKLLSGSPRKLWSE